VFTTRKEKREYTIELAMRMISGLRGEEVKDEIPEEKDRYEEVEKTKKKPAVKKVKKDWKGGKKVTLKERQPMREKKSANLSDTDSEKAEKVKREVYKEAGVEKPEKEKKSIVSQIGEGVEAVGRKLQEWGGQKTIKKQQEEYQQKVREEMEDRAKAKGKGKGKKIERGTEEEELRAKRSVFLGNLSGDQSLAWLTPNDEEGWQRKRKYEQSLMLTLEKQLGRIKKLTVKFGKRTGMLELEGEQEDAERRVEDALQRQPRISDLEGNRVFMQKMRPKYETKGEGKGKEPEKGEAKGSGKRRHEDDDDLSETERMEAQILERRRNEGRKQYENSKQKHEILKTEVKTAWMRRSAADFLMKSKKNPTKEDYDRFERNEDEEKEAIHALEEFERHEKYQREEQEAEAEAEAEVEVIDLEKSEKGEKDEEVPWRIDTKIYREYGAYFAQETKKEKEVENKKNQEKSETKRKRDDDNKEPEKEEKKKEKEKEREMYPWSKGSSSSSAWRGVQVQHMQSKL